MSYHLQVTFPHMVDMDGNDIGNRKYFEFGMDENISVITAATQNLAKELLAFLKK